MPRLPRSLGSFFNVFTTPVVTNAVPNWVADDCGHVAIAITSSSDAAFVPSEVTLRGYQSYRFGNHSDSFLFQSCRALRPTEVSSQNLSSANAERIASLWVRRTLIRPIPLEAREVPNIQNELSDASTYEFSAFIEADFLRGYCPRVDDGRQ